MQHLFHEFTLTYNKQSKGYMYVYLTCCPRGGGGGDAGKLSRNRGKSAVYIYTPLILLTGLITDCAPLVLIRLII